MSQSLLRQERTNMTKNKITNEEIEACKIANLPTRPTSPEEFGGRGYSAAQLKAAFDALPLLICERLNGLIDDLTGGSNSTLNASLKTGITEEHTLEDFFQDLTSGEAASYITVLGKTLNDTVVSIEESIAQIREILERNSLI